MTVGCKVTLRKDRMYEFLDRLITIALPRVKDFRGPEAEELRRPRQLRLGLKEHIVFPEINYDQIDQIWGMDVIVVHHRRRPTTRRASYSAASISRSAAER